ncbi:cation-transporting P-type ATPase, partial [Rhodotorula toruloides]
GLTASQVEENQRKYGKNVLPEEPSPSLWELILKQFKDQLVLILLASAGILLVLAYLEEGE